MRATSVVVVGMIRTLQIIEDILLILAFHSCISSFGIHPSTTLCLALIAVRMEHSIN